jgi:DNA polymerase-3 subunit gamma/tau
VSVASTPAPPTAPPTATAPATAPAPAPITLSQPDQWPSFIASLPISGMALQLARQSECLSVQPHALSLRVPTQALAQGPHAERLLTVLKQTLGEHVQVSIVVGELVTGVSAHNIDEQAQQVRQLKAEQSVSQDPFVQTLIRDFDAHVIPGSVQPVPPTLH